MYDKIQKTLKKRVLLLDGAMGTMIQHKTSQCPDVLCLTDPKTIRDIHRQYLEAGADIITTNTFNANAVALRDYGLAESAYRIAVSGARLAREEADRMTALTPQQPRFVAGCIGPTSRKAYRSAGDMISDDHCIPFDELTEAYTTQIEGLLDGGADLLLIETVWHLLNAQAALTAVEHIEARRGVKLPVMVSATLAQCSDKLLSGESLEEFYSAVAPFRPLSVGLNCSNGAEGLLAPLRLLSEIAECSVSCHPNAGFPDASGDYPESSDTFADKLKELIEEGIVAIIGGCCGTTPAHIAALRRHISC